MPEKKTQTSNQYKMELWEDDFIEEIQNHLDTRDKRFMFLKCMFPKSVAVIELEGSARHTALNIYTHFKRQNMRGSLAACMNSVFNTDIVIPNT